MGAISPAGFSLLSSSQVENSIELPISSNAVTIGDMLTLAIGSTTWSDATSTTEHWQLKAIAMETVASSASAVLCELVVSGQQWACETANNSDVLHNGDRMVLTDTNTVNNTGTDSTADDAVVIQLTPLYLAADKRIKGLIVPGTGVDPDAT